MVRMRWASVNENMDWRERPEPRQKVELAAPQSRDSIERRQYIRVDVEKS